MAGQEEGGDYSRGKPQDSKFKHFCKRNHIFQVPNETGSGSAGRTQFVCQVCNYIISNGNKIRSHVNSNGHIKRKELHEISLLKEIPSPTPDHVRELNLCLEIVCKEYGISEGNMKARTDIRHCMQYIADKAELGCDVRLVGSSAHGVGLKSSVVDIDISVRENKQNTPKVLMKILDIVKTSDQFCDVVDDLHSKRPTINLVDVKSKLKVKVNAGSSFIPRTAQLLKIYCDLDPRVKILGTALRYWSHICGLDDVDGAGLTSYVCFLMITYYLQQISPPVLPVLCVDKNHGDKKDTEEDKDRVETVQDLTNVAKEAKKWQTKNREQVGKLWLNFFKFYLLDFKMEESVISIRTHDEVSRSQKGWGNRRFAIEDPFARKFNVGDPMASKEGGKTSNRHSKDVDGLEPTNISGTNDKGKLSEKTSHHTFNNGTQDDAVQDNSISDDVIVLVENCQIKDQDSVSLTKGSDLGVAKDCELETLYFNFDVSRLTGRRRKPNELSPSWKGKRQRSKSYSQAEEVFPLPPLTPEFENILSMFCKKISDESCISSEDRAKRNSVLHALQSHLRRSYFPDCRLHLFGSSVNAFGMKDSDLDICMLLNEDLTPPKGFNQKEFIESLKRSLKRMDQLEEVSTIPSAKVPICKFRDRISRLHGDISFYNVLAQRNSSLLRTYAMIDDRVRQLGFVIKRFAKICSIGDASRGSLSSYAYIIMLLHYLQHCSPPVLPVLQELYDGDEQPTDTVEGWNCWFFNDNKQLKNRWPGFGLNQQSTGELLLGFFRYYVEVFDFRCNVVCIRQSQRLTKFEKIWTGAFIAIEDPFKLSHNLGRGVSEDMLRYILNAFARGRERFGIPVTEFQEQSAMDYFYNAEYLTGNLSIPKDWVCRACGHVGHRANTCERKKNQAEEKRKGQGSKTPQNRTTKELSEQKKPKEEGKKDQKGKESVVTPQPPGFNFHRSLSDNVSHRSGAPSVQDDVGIPSFLKPTADPGRVKEEIDELNRIQQPFQLTLPKPEPTALPPKDSTVVQNPSLPPMDSIWGPLNLSSMSSSPWSANTPSAPSALFNPLKEGSPSLPSAVPLHQTQKNSEIPYGSATSPNYKMTTATERVQQYTTNFFTPQKEVSNDFMSFLPNSSSVPERKSFSFMAELEKRSYEKQKSRGMSFEELAKAFQGNSGLNSSVRKTPCIDGNNCIDISSLESDPSAHTKRSLSFGDFDGTNFAPASGERANQVRFQSSYQNQDRSIFAFEQDEDRHTYPKTDKSSSNRNIPQFYTDLDASSSILLTSQSQSGNQNSKDVINSSAAIDSDTSEEQLIRDAVVASVFSSENVESLVPGRASFDSDRHGNDADTDTSVKGGVKNDHIWRQSKRGSHSGKYDRMDELRQHEEFSGSHSHHKERGYRRGRGDGRGGRGRGRGRGRGQSNWSRQSFD